MPLTASAAAVLADWLAVRGGRPGGLFLPITKGGRIAGDRMTSRAIYTVLEKSRRQAGVDRLSPHDFRGGTVVRGAVRVVTVLIAEQHERGGADLRPIDCAASQARRQHLEGRQETRRAQRRFRRDPARYLAALEQQLLM